MHRDHLGSILAISNELGYLIEKRHFDPWGNIVRYYNEYTGAKTPFGDALDEAMFLDRGYTSHEHLLSVGLINMNARLYDPVVHRFLQPDAFVQDPTNTQCYNRYGYASNNPLKYNDPSGNILPALAIAAIIGAGIGAATYTLTALLADVPFSVSGLLQSVAISAISSVATTGIAQGFGAIANFSTAPAGFWNGAVIGASTGFVTGIFGSALNTVINGGCIKLGQLLKDGLIGAAVGGLIGGISAGASAKKQGLDYRSGDGISKMQVVSPDIAVPSTERVKYTNADAKNFSDSEPELSKLSKNITELHADSTTPSSRYEMKEGFIYDKIDKDLSYGITQTNSSVSGQTIKVYLAEKAFISRPQLYMTMHHEYMHGYFISNNLGLNIDQQHNIIHNWHADQASRWGSVPNIRRVYYSSTYCGNVDTYSKFGFKIINHIP